MKSVTNELMQKNKVCLAARDVIFKWWEDEVYIARINTRKHFLHSNKGPVIIYRLGRSGGFRGGSDGYLKN